ncbi:MAG: RNA chaperone Hfq [Synechococcus sp.]
MTDLNTSIPSTRWLQGMVREKATLSVGLVSGERVSGQLKWIDPKCICLTDETGGEQLIWQHAISTISASK